MIMPNRPGPQDPSDSLIDRIDAAAAARLLRALEELDAEAGDAPCSEAGAASVLGRVGADAPVPSTRPRGVRTRSRAAFTRPFGLTGALLLAVLVVGAAGWISAYRWYRVAMIADRSAAAANDLIHRQTAELEDLRDAIAGPAEPASDASPRSDD